MTAPKISRRWYRWLLSSVGATVILLLSVLSAQGGDPRAIWLSTEVQAINLEPFPVCFTASFFTLDGNVAYTFTGTLEPGQARIYRPHEMVPPLPETFTGTVSFEADGQIGLEVLHTSEAITAGNMVLEGVADPLLKDRAFFPVDRCVRVYIHNLAPLTASMEVSAFDLLGIPVGSLFRQVVGEGTEVLYPLVDLGLPLDFLGSGVVLADGPVEVTVRWLCDGEGSFVAPPAGSTTLFLPRVPAYLPGQVTPTLELQNTTESLASGAIRFADGTTTPFILLPLGSVFLSLSGISAPTSAVIQSSFPIGAYLSVRSREAGREGAFFYRALGIEEATEAVALPVIWNEAAGWSTGDNLWVQNTAAQTASVKLRYTTVPTGTLVWQEGTVPPGGVRQVTVPPLPASRAGAILLADQPILALAGATNPHGDLGDRWMLYRGTNFTFTCEESAGADFTWLPAAPVAGETIAFTAYASGTEPISFAWDFGDGTLGSGPSPTHTYDLPGSYAVALTATNCLGFGVAAARHTLEVACAEVSGADFSWGPAEPAVGQPVSFTAAASGTEPISFAWDFGDGTLGSGPSLTHTYDLPGPYTVLLTATNCQGAGVLTVTHGLTVTYCEEAHDAGFSWQPLVPKVGEEVFLTAYASGTAPISFTWDFGDGFTGTGALVTHTYFIAGPYTITLEAANACSELPAAAQHILTVAPEPWKLYLPLVIKSHGGG